MTTRRNPFLSLMRTIRNSEEIAEDPRVGALYVAVKAEPALLMSIADDREYLKLVLKAAYQECEREEAESKAHFKELDLESAKAFIAETEEEERQNKSAGKRD